jgi:hypothetical protein
MNLFWPDKREVRLKEVLYSRESPIAVIVNTGQ